MFGVDHVQAMEFIVRNESGFRLNAINKSSGACGLGQALPCSKMGCQLNFSGVDCQVNWVTKYIKDRYTNPLNAEEFWKEHHWY